MTYIKVILFIGLLFTTTFTKAQDSLTPERVQELTELYRSAKGTFQIQTEGTRKTQSFQLSMMDQIETARSETEIIFIPYGEHGRIVILPKRTILSKKFVPLKLYSHTYSDEPVY